MTTANRAPRTTRHSQASGKYMRVEQGFVTLIRGQAIRKSMPYRCHSLPSQAMCATTHALAFRIFARELTKEGMEWRGLDRVLITMAYS